MTHFADITTWVFDLDNTLYPAECNLFAEVDKRMAAYIADALNLPLNHARYLQKDYYRRYGTTLNGLMKLHGLEPDPFLEFVHDIDLSTVEPAPNLERALKKLEGRKFIYTNGSRRHAERVAERLGVLSIFEDITDIASNDFCAKPDLAAYEKFLSYHKVSADAAVMFDDMPHNLKAPHQLGMKTVLVHSSYIDHPAQLEMKSWRAPPQHIHFETEDLTAFLEQTQP